MFPNSLWFRNSLLRKSHTFCANLSKGFDSFVKSAKKAGKIKRSLLFWPKMIFALQILLIFAPHGFKLRNRDRNRMCNGAPLGALREGISVRQLRVENQSRYSLRRSVPFCVCGHFLHILRHFYFEGPGASWWMCHSLFLLPKERRLTDGNS